MFSMKDICDVAIQIEKNGEQVYRNAQAETNNDKLRKLLGWMADEENQHALWFAKLAEKEAAPVQHPQIEEMGENLLKDSIGDQTFSLNETDLHQATTITQVIEQAIEFEKDTVIFYEMLREFIDDEVVLGQLDIIIQEEQNHIRKLSTFFDSYSIK